MKQVIPGGYYNLLSASATEYNCVAGGTDWYSDPDDSAQAVSTAGTIRNLRVELNDSPGAGKSYAFTLYRRVGVGAWAATALTCTIAGTAVSAADTVNEVTVAAGDVIALECVPTGTPTTRYARWTMQFEGDTASESLLLITIYASNAENRYTGVMGHLYGGTSTEADMRQVCPTSGKIKNLYAQMEVDPGTSPDAYRFTLRVNGVSSALTCTITADDLTGNDAAHEVTVAAGDALTLFIEPLNTPSASSYTALGMTFVADTDGESLIMGGSSDSVPSAGTEYNLLTPGAVNLLWVATESERYQLAQECTFKKLYMLLSAAPGSGKSWTFTVRQNGASPGSGLVVVIADDATTGNDTANTIAIADGDEVDLMVVPGGSPGTLTDAYWGLVCYIEAAAPTVVTPGVIALTLTKYAPIIKEVTTPATLALSDTEYVPVLKEVTTPTTLALILTEYAPVFGDGVVPATLALVITTYVPIIKEVVTPATLALNDTEYIPILKETTTPGVINLTLTTYAPSIIGGTAVTPGTVALTITEYAPSLIEGTVVTPTTLSLILTEYAPVIGMAITITPSTVSLTLTGYAPVIGIRITPSTASLITTIYAPILKLVLIPSTLSISLTEYAPVLNTGIVIGLLGLVLTKYASILKEVVTPDKLGLNTVPYIPSVFAATTITPGKLSLSTTGYSPVIGVGAYLIPNIINLITDTYAPSVHYCEWVDLPVRVPISSLDSTRIPISRLPLSRTVRRCK